VPLWKHIAQKSLNSRRPCSPSRRQRNVNLGNDRPAMFNKGGHPRIYYMEGWRSYHKTTAPKRWFCTEEDAQAAKFRKAYAC
jgi:hypothetical protein